MTSSPVTPALPLAPGSAAFESLLLAIGEGAARRDRVLEAPFDAVEAVATAGLGRLRIPVEEGGAGVSVRTLFNVIIDLARADSNVAHVLRTHYSFVEKQLPRRPSPARDAAIALVNSGAIVGNAVSEKGSKPVGPFFSTMLTPLEGGGYRLDGEKYYSTGTMYSDWIQVMAATPSGDIAAALVPTDRDGVTVVDDWDGFGQRLTATGSTRFEHVLVADDEVNVLGPPESSPSETYQNTFLQLYLQAVTTGILLAVGDDAVRLLQGRSRNFSHAPSAVPATDPHLLAVVGEISADAFAARAIVAAAADAIDAAASAAIARAPEATELAVSAQLAAAQAKVFIDGFAPATAARLFDVGGTSATSTELNLDRHWRNIRTVSTHNPTVLKAAAVGDLLVNGTVFPNNGYF